MHLFFSCPSYVVFFHNRGSRADSRTEQWKTPILALFFFLFLSLSWHKLVLRVLKESTKVFLYPSRAIALSMHANMSRIIKTQETKRSGTPSAATSIRDRI